MNTQSDRRYWPIIRSILALGLLCVFGVSPYIVTNGQEVPAAERSPEERLLLASAEGDSRAPIPLKELKIHGALAALDDSWPDVQSRAFAELDTLNALSLIAPEYVLQLAELLKHPRDEVRVSALKVLAKIGEPAAEFLPQIGALLVHKEPDVRAPAVAAIGQLGKGREDVYLSPLVLLLDDYDRSVRMAAVRALAKLDPEGQSYLPLIETRLKSPTAEIRAEGVLMLEELGEIAEAYVPNIVKLLDDSDPNVRRNAVTVLGRLGIPDAQAIAQIATRLDDRQWRVRVAAAQSLCRMSPASLEYIPRILALLDDDDENVRAAVIAALGTLRRELLPYIDDILKHTSDPSPDVRAAVLDVFSMLGNDTDRYLDVVTAHMQDESWEVRAAAVRALGNMESVGTAALPLVEPLLQDPDWYVRSYAIKALGSRIRPEEFDSDIILAILHDPEGSVRASAVWVLGNWERRAIAYLPQFLELLHDPHAGVQQATLRAIRNLGHVPMDAFLALLDMIDSDPTRTPELRFLAHSLGAGEKTAEVLLQWAGNPAIAVDLMTLSLPRAREALDAFARAESESVGSNASVGALRRLADLSGQIIIQMKPFWDDEDIPVLASHVASLRANGSPVYRSAWQILWELKIRWFVNQPLVQGLAIGMLHPIVWLGLWLLFPHVRTVRVVFFWNPYVRWGLGLGYIHFVLIKLPFLRKRLFLPYRQTLLSDADLSHFDDVMYEKDVRVLDEHGRQSIAIHTAIPVLQGKILLEGESGLGKTTFVRYLLKYCLRPVAYLPAEKCTEGLAAAFLPKMRGECYDEGFLRALICEGAVDLCIDGLDAISMKNRANLSHVLMYSCRGNILITTRPIEWTSRQAYQTYVIQPLQPEHLERFLRKCYRLMLPEALPMSRAEYVLACGNYLQQMFPDTVTGQELTVQQQALTNPLNLTLVAFVCAFGKTPDLARLMEQCYQIMATTYQRENDDVPFPLQQFSERVYRMRLNDEGILPSQRFEKEIEWMATYAMILKRSSCDLYGNATTEWYFRNEMIADFFIFQAFQEENSQRIERHLGDSRFHGVYALLERSAQAQHDTRSLDNTSLEHLIQTPAPPLPNML